MKSAEKKSAISGTVGLEAKLWAAADALRNYMDAAEYKHVVLGLIVLKYSNFWPIGTTARTRGNAEAEA